MAARRIQPVWRGAVLRSRLKRTLAASHDEEDEDGLEKVDIDQLTSDVSLQPESVVELVKRAVLAAAPTMSSDNHSSHVAGSEKQTDLFFRFDVPATVVFPASGAVVARAGSAAPATGATAASPTCLGHGGLEPRRPASETAKRPSLPPRPARAGLNDVSSPAVPTEPSATQTTVDASWGSAVAARIQQKNKKVQRAQKEFARREFLVDPLHAKKLANSTKSAKCPRSRPAKAAPGSLPVTSGASCKAASTATTSSRKASLPQSGVEAATAPPAERDPSSFKDPAAKLARMPSPRGTASSIQHPSRSPFSWNRLRFLLTRFIFFVVQLCIQLRMLLRRIFLCAEDAVEVRRRQQQQMSRTRAIVPVDSDTAGRYRDNTVINSRYTVFNFVFKNLYEQFRRPLNLYFFLVTMLQFISIIAPVNPMSTLLPLLFAFSLTAVKEGYDDVKRHRQDTAYNNQWRTVLQAGSGHWARVRNCDIRVGDVVLLHQDEEIPCDCVVLAAPSASVFMRTDNLDGEIDLKPRDVISPLVEPVHHVGTVNGSGGEPAVALPPASMCLSGRGEGVKSLTAPAAAAAQLTFFSLDDDVPTLTEKLRCLTLHCPPPSAIVDAFEGIAAFTKADLTTSSMAPHAFGASGTSASTVRSSPTAMTSTNARGSGYSGEAARTDDLNSGMGDNDSGLVKISLSHRNLLLQSCVLKNTSRALCVAIYTGDDTKCGMNKRPPPVKWAKIDKDVSRYSVFIFCCQLVSAVGFGIAGYVANAHIDRTHWYLPRHPLRISASFIIYPLRFFLLTTVMIPVSFKFVVDMSKYYMAMSVEWDEAMAHGDHGGCKVNNSSILEDLGQIDYVLSDKTGTMTQNVMELQYVSVVPDFQIDLTAMDMPKSVCASPTVMQAYPLYAHSRKTDGGEERQTIRSHASSLLSTEVRHFASMLALCNTVEVTAIPLPFDGGGGAGTATEASAIATSPGSTVLHSPLGEEAISYQAASPDEVALCCGAAKLHVVLQQRTLHHAYLRVHDIDTEMMSGAFEDQEWFVHHVFAFSSERKAMGVIVEHRQRKRILFVVKGADDSVATMLRGSDRRASVGISATPCGAPPLDTWETTYPVMARHLRAYAKRGLRTLLVAQREISRQELDDFLRDHREAEVSMDNRQERIDTLRSAMERGLELVGITAIEDKLQENVRETIGDVLSAGVKVWMLTGDKVETAEQIGLSCGLYGPHDRVVRLVEGGTEETREAWVETLMHTELPPASQQRPWSALHADERRASLSLGRRVVDAIRLAGVARQSAEDGLAAGGNAVGGDIASEDSGSGDGLSLSSPTGVAQRTVVVVQGGHVLERILNSPVLSARFGSLSQRCVSVVCARTTPSQKAMVTSFVRMQGKMTLSIGDGGNDVAMIQEAHVGVGIIGKEGRQAARAADFAVTRFSDLRQLLFVHGQQAYVRTAYVIKYSFYKSMLISFIQLAYNMCGVHYSGGTFWNSFSLTMWNGVYTLPQTLFYCLDRCAPRVVLERCPALYKLSRRGTDMDVKEFFGSYVMRGVVQSIALFALVTSTLGDTFAFSVHGYASSNDINFTVAYTALILSQMITVYFESHSVTGLNLFWLVFMPAFYIASTLAYSGIPTLQYYGVLSHTMRAEFWLAAVAIAVTLTLPVLLLLGLREAVMPNSRDILRSAEIRRQHTLLQQVPGYRKRQSIWVRWLGCTPEVPSAALTALGVVSPVIVRGPSTDVTVEAAYSSVV